MQIRKRKTKKSTLIKGFTVIPSQITPILVVLVMGFVKKEVISTVQIKSKKCKYVFNPYKRKSLHLGPVHSK